MKKISYVILALLTVSCTRNDMKYDASGTFEATEITVSAETQGKLLFLNCDEGTKLKKGEVVACVDTVQTYLQKLQLEASNKAVVSKKSDINKQIAAQKEEIKKQKRELKRYQELMLHGAATDKQVDDLSAQLKVLERRLQATLSTLNNGNSSLTAESSALDIQVARLNDLLNKSQIKAPVDGTVLAKYTEANEIVNMGAPIFKIADLRQMFLRCYVTSKQLADIKVGQSVKVISDYGDDIQKTYNGTISWISDTSEFTPKSIQTDDDRGDLVYAVKVAVKNDGLLKIGMYGWIKFKS
ncbi:MAG: HlyD family efflux transporter periplasmic adaptor subunit [Bacteroidaceae bacterium]|nr:HlyD family efflux transporter periplasmic adaptor subunit [Bacteroidaceae bacterium]